MLQKYCKGNVPEKPWIASQTFATRIADFNSANQRGIDFSNPRNSPIKEKLESKFRTSGATDKLDYPEKQD